MITTTEFGRIRREVMKNLAPDFVKNKNVYVRESENGQIHCLGFTLFGRDSEYSLQFGAHYHFIPSFKIYSAQHKAIHPEPATCMLSSGYVTDDSRSYNYGETPASAKEKLEAGVSNSLTVLNCFNDKWGNGEAMLEVLTPEVMQQDAYIFQKALNADNVPEQDKLIATLAIRREFPELDPLVGPVSMLLAF